MNPAPPPDRRRAILLAAAAAGAACARLRVYPAGEPAFARDSTRPSYTVDASTRPVRRRPQDVLLSEITPTGRRAVYYSDLGPDTIDVSSYPARQRYNYAVYAEACARCHTLARSINAPMVGRGFWRMYLLGMRFNAAFRRAPGFPPEDREAILDFLEYDSRARKVEHRPEFEARQEELLRRYFHLLDERLGDLQQGRPLLHAPGPE